MSTKDEVLAGMAAKSEAEAESEASSSGAMAGGAQPAEIVCEETQEAVEWQEGQQENVPDGTQAWEEPAEEQVPVTEEYQPPVVQTDPPTVQTERYVVSQEYFDDCDGSGHGYYIITYSDGSTKTVEY